MFVDGRTRMTEVLRLVLRSRHVFRAKLRKVVPRCEKSGAGEALDLCSSAKLCKDMQTIEKQSLTIMSRLL